MLLAVYFSGTCLIYQRTTSRRGCSNDGIRIRAPNALCKRFLTIHFFRLTVTCPCLQERQEFIKRGIQLIVRVNHCHGSNCDPYKAGELHTLPHMMWGIQLCRMKSRSSVAVGAPKTKGNETKRPSVSKKNAPRCDRRNAFHDSFPLLIARQIT